MKPKRSNRVLAALLSLVLLVGLIPAAASAAEMQSGTSTLTVNQSKVAFAGHEWWVIGDGASGVYPQQNHITLLAANLDSEFQNTTFRTGSSSQFDNSTLFSQGTLYYANNPQGMENWTTPNEYAGSTLQQKMEEIAKSFPEKEQNAINARDLAGTAAGDIAGQGIADQKLWAISEEEWNTINNSTVRAYGGNWWLRSPYPGSSVIALMGRRTYLNSTTNAIVNEGASARPALSLKLSSVLFTSAAEGGKSSATVGGGLLGAEATTRNGEIHHEGQFSNADGNRYGKPK